MEERRVGNRQWIQRVEELHRAYWRETELHVQDGQDAVRPETLIRSLEQLVSEDAVMVLDTGEHTVWFNRMFRASRQLPLFSGKWRTMGFALPAGIAAKLIVPERQVVVLVGDGGLLMNAGELMTLADHKLHVTVVVVNNHSLGLEEAKMKWEGLSPFGTRLNNPDFANLANAFGLTGFRVEKAAQLADTLREAVAIEGPTLVDVRCTGPTLSERKTFFSLQTQA